MRTKKWTVKCEHGCGVLKRVGNKQSAKAYALGHLSRRRHSVIISDGEEVEQFDQSEQKE